MLIRRAVITAVFPLLVLAAHAQSIDVTGVWSGPVGPQPPCVGASASLQVTANLQQSGSSITGSGTLVGPEDLCAPGSPSSTINITAISATITGSQISGFLTVSDSSGTQVTTFSATVTGNSMILNVVVGPGESVSGTLTRANPPAGDYSGTWGGTFNASDACGSGSNPEQIIPWTSPATVLLSQHGSAVTGAIVVYQVPEFTERCTAGSYFTFVIPLQGSVAGNTITGVGTAETPISVNAAVTGNSMAVHTASDSFSASGDFTRSGSGMPASTLSGSYSGSFTDGFIPCINTDAQLAPFTYSGTVSGTGTEVGAAFFATFTAVGSKSDAYDPHSHTCTIVDDDSAQAVFSGLISGNTLNGLVFPDGSGHRLTVLTATISGATITGRIAGENPGERGVTFSITRAGSSAAAPRIVSFVATPPAIRTGHSSTLSWSTDAATAITIDNGLGAQASSGSLTVTPSATTTYTLTATAGTQSTTAAVTVEVLSAPIVNVTMLPAPMLQVAASGGAITTYAVTNSGSAATTITLTQSGSFFTQAPSSFTLAAGATQVVTISGTAQPEGSYEGASMIAGDGAPPNLQLPVKLVSTPAPSGPVTADPTQTRVDVAAPASSSPGGSVSFKNNGSARLVGVLDSDVPWIIPQGGTVTIDPGQTGTFNFTIDRSRRPDAGAAVGSAVGNLTLSFLSGGGALGLRVPLDTAPVMPSISIVKVVDTVQPAVTIGGIPALAAGEVALLIAGVGHTTGIGGVQFVSDVSLLNPQGSRAVNDVKMYYTSTSGSAASAKTTALPAVPAQVSVAVADVVKSVFSGNDERGTLQIRSQDAGKLAVAATVLTTNTPGGTFGNSIPVFRSDRAIGSGESLVLTGLQKDGTTHTNLYIQEAAGAAASVQSDFLRADGSTISSRTDAVDPFKLLPLDNVVPAGAVAAVLTNTSSGAATIVAYATPVDERSNDTWAIPDWAHQLGYAPDDPVIIPVAGSVHGANNTFYRTEVALTNRGSEGASGSLRYIARNGTIAEQQISLAGHETKVIDDVIASLNLAGDTVGFLSFTPLTGSTAVSSRTFTTAGTKPDTFGSSVPALAAASALQIGRTRPIAGLADASRATVVAGKPATYRTNFALMETSGRTATVRVTFRFTFPAGEKVQGIGAASRDYVLNPDGFLLLNSIAGEILGAARLQYGDLTNVEADFQVIDGNGAVMLFTSTVDNATGDSILRTE